MGRYDDFNLDLKKAASRSGIDSASTGTVFETIATACFTFDGSNTCNCPSTDCSPCDMTTSCRKADEQILRC